MLDGRIDTQGTVKDLRTKGILDTIAQESPEEVQEKKEEEAIEVIEEAAEPDTAKKADKSTKQARKLIQEEERETGGVKWEIYKTYLRAS